MFAHPLWQPHKLPRCNPYVGEGRTLTSYEDDERIAHYEYDENGMRYRTRINNKADGTVLDLEYVWLDGKLISIVCVNDGETTTAKYLYNADSEPVGMVLTDADGTLSTYYYLKNMQGDITHIVSASGKLLVEFTYDVFGKQTVHYQANGSTIIGMIELVEQVMVCALNPFGYRGYCYDTYTGLYYLQSRYYDPETGRFINADDTNYLNATGTVLGCNLFAYCENDPVNGVDPLGYYDPEKAVRYASIWWNGRNIQYYSYGFLGGDCTNFVSQCLLAGGYKMDKKWYSYHSTKQKKGYDKQVRFERLEYVPLTGDYVSIYKKHWYKVSDAWNSASKLYEYLMSKYPKKCYPFKNKKDLQKNIKNGKISKGDVAFFQNKKNGIHHAVIIGSVSKTNKIEAYYYAHTSNRNAAEKKYGLVLALNNEVCIYVFDLG